MTTTAATKIFIDVDEELVFVLEKILAAPKERVILVIPAGSTLTTSLISMRVLAKQIILSNKLVVVAAEEQNVKKTANRAGLVNVSKVSDVTPEVWEKVQLHKERDMSLLQRHEQVLLDSRNEQVKSHDSSVSAGETIKLENVVDTEAEKKASGLIKDENISVPKDKKKINNDTPKEKQQEEEVNIPKKKRIPAKVVEVDGLKIISGGDIKQMGEQDEDNEPLREELDVAEGRGADDSPATKTDYVGKDWTRATKGAKPTRNIGAKLPSIKMPNLRSLNLGNKRLIALLVVGALILVVPFLLISNAFVLVDITLEKSEATVEEIVTALESASGIDEEMLTINAEKITLSTAVSRSTSKQTSGTGQTGDKAAGLIDFYNQSTEGDITVPGGTRITSASTGLVYLVREEFVVPKKVGDTPGNEDDIAVVAEHFGEQYNIEGSDVNQSFSVDGIDNVVAIRFRDFTGGTSRDIQVVSQSDFDKAKNELKGQVRDAALAELVNNVPDGYTIVNGTQKYQEGEASAIPDIGEEAAEFDMSVEGTATAFAVSVDDLKQIAQILIKDSQDGRDVEIENLAVPEIANVSVQEEGVTFTISSNGQLQSKLNEELIMREITGRNINEVKAYLTDEFSDIEKFEIDYSPGFLPEFLQIFPSDPDQIRIRIN